MIPKLVNSFGFYFTFVFIGSHGIKNESKTKGAAVIKLHEDKLAIDNFNITNSDSKNSSLFTGDQKHMTDLLFRCQKWGNVYPEKDGVGKSCNMSVDLKDMDEFLFNIRKTEYKTRLFQFRLNFKNTHVFKTQCVIKPTEWVWTFPGERGALHFLKWPYEYKIWSLGLLDFHTFGPMNITISVKGNCPTIIGQKNTTERIGLALLEMTNRAASLPAGNVEYGYGYVCYSERIFIKSKIMWSICLHLVCPFEALGYKCCKTVYEYKTNSSRTLCDGNLILYDDAWWVIPLVIGILLFTNAPLILVNPFQKERICTTLSIRMSEIPNEKHEWLIGNPLSFSSIIFSSLQYAGSKFPSVLTSIVLRTLVVLSGLVVLVNIQLLVHYYYDYQSTLELVKGGVPLSFRSMVTGYTNSRQNFMPMLGGPYRALAIYLIMTILLVCMPRDLQTFIANGIPDNQELSISPLTMDVKTRSQLGGIYNVEQQTGYEKIYSLMKGHIFMLINPSFWKLSVQMQIRRFWGLLNVVSFGKTVKVVLMLVMFLPYFLVFCVAELALSAIYYGLPIFLFFRILVCAYCKGVKEKIACFGFGGKILQYTLTILIVLMLVFNIYIMSVVFIDSFHFITRVVLFSFTGLIAYPGTTYGYFVFSITVLMYVTEAIQHIRSGYSDLFAYVRKACLKLRQRNDFSSMKIYQHKNGVDMISKELYMFVVSRHRPIRVEIFFSVLKLVFITLLMYIAINIIVKLQSLWDINPLTQVITAIFICLIPKLWHKMMTKDEYLYDVNEFVKIQNIIQDYCRQKIRCIEMSLNIRNEDDGPSNQADTNEDRPLLGEHSGTTRYNTLTSFRRESESEDEEMRSDLLLDLANDI